MINNSIPDNDFNPLVVGIDPHSDILGIIYMTKQHQIIRYHTIPNCSKSHFDELIANVNLFAKDYNLTPVFVIESTNVFWRPLFSYLKCKGFEKVYTVSSMQTNSSRKTKMRKTKTDKIDSRNIAEVYLQGNAHLTQFPSNALFDLRELTRLHSWVTDIKGRILNRIYGYIFQVFPESSSVFPKKYFSKTVMTLTKKKLFHPDSMTKTDYSKLKDLIRRISRNKHTGKVDQLLSFAANSTGITEGKTGFEDALKLLTGIYSFLDACTLRLESKSIKPLLKKLPDNTLSSIKGFSTVAQASFISELGDPSKFSTADQATAFFGFDPALGQSGRRKGQGKHISKAGSKYARETMFMAATPVMIHNPVFKRRYQNIKKKRNRHFIDAKVILAADLTKICYAMYRDNVEFDPGLIH